MRQEGDGYVLSSGRTFYANNGIIGIAPGLDISEGYDGGIEEEYFTKEENREIAIFMIMLWTKWGMRNGKKD